MGYELERATLEAERNAAVDAYIEARPQLDSIHNRRIFEAGFERAWNLRQNEVDVISAARALAAKQAKDDGLWFNAMTAPEAYLQNALRELASAIEVPN